MAPSLREEFDRRKFLLEFCREDSFYTSQWKWPPLCVMVWRVFAAVYVLCWNLASYIVNPFVGKHFILVYLTQWTYLLLCIYLIMAAVVTICHYVASNLKAKKLARRQQSHQNPSFEVAENGSTLDGKPVSRSNGSNDANRTQENIQVLGATDVEDGATRGTLGVTQDKPITLHLKVMWVLFNIVSVMALVVTLVYFCVLYPIIRIYNPAYVAGAFDVNVHAMNSVIILIEVFITAVPTRIAHFYQPILYGSVYVLWSVIYWAADKQHNVLYPFVLDWNSPGTSIGCVLLLAIIGIPLLQLLFYGLYRLRLKIYEKVYHESYI